MKNKNNLAQRLNRAFSDFFSHSFRIDVKSLVKVVLKKPSKFHSINITEFDTKNNMDYNSLIVLLYSRKISEEHQLLNNLLIK